MDAPVDLDPLELIGAVPRGLQDRVVSVVQIDDVTRLGDDGRGVRAREHLSVLAHPDEERAAVAGDDDLLGIPRRHDGDAVCALDLAERRGHGVLERHSVTPEEVDEVHHDLGVGLGRELVALVDELRLDDVGVLDDPVVDERDVAAGRGVRVRVGLVGRAVRRPAGVRDAAGGVRRQRLDRLLERPDLARPLDHFDARVVQESDPRRIVPAILEALEPLDQDRGRFLGSHVSDDPAHRRCSSVGLSAPLPATARAPERSREGMTRSL